MTKINIGGRKENDIVLKRKNSPDIHAEITYYRGNWIFKNLIEKNPVFINGEKIEAPRHLNKNDIITIGKQTIHWSNYLYEGETQELNLKDIISFNGRISRSNFRTLSLLSIGLIICVLFLPGLLVAILESLSILKFDSVNTIQEVQPVVYILGFSVIGILLLLLAIKRIRDTGHPIWKLWIPIYNLKILYFELSKK